MENDDELNYVDWHWGYSIGWVAGYNGTPISENAYSPTDEPVGYKRWLEGWHKGTACRNREVSQSD